MDLLGTNFDPRLLLVVVVLVGLLVLETVQPYMAQYSQDRLGLKNRGRHAAWNLGVGIVNSVMVALLFVWLWQASTQWASTAGFGLLNLWELPTSVRLIAAVILLDLWTYWWHRLNHCLPSFGGFTSCITRIRRWMSPRGLVFIWWKSGCRNSCAFRC